MENWGLATYREYLLLIDRRVAEMYHQQAIVGLISHELLHMVSLLHIHKHKNVNAFIFQCYVHNIIDKYKSSSYIKTLILVFL